MKRTETDHVDPESVTRVSTMLREMSRYDLVLGVIPLSLLTSVVGASVTALALEPVLGVGALVSLLAMLDALFANPPGASGSGDEAERPRQRRAR